MHRFWARVGVAVVASLLVWFAFMIGAIVIVSSLSQQGAINLWGGIAIFAGLISLALIGMGGIWLAWYRDHRRRRAQR
jgi:hypothetical protein